jgi:hypothetical protein
VHQTETLQEHGGAQNRANISPLRVNLDGIQILMLKTIVNVTPVCKVDAAKDVSVLIKFHKRQ